MSFISQRIRDVIADVGQKVTFVDRISTFNSATGENTHTDSSIVTKGFLRKYSPQELTGGLVQQIDRELRIAVDSLTIIPKESDQLTVSGKTYTIVSVDHVNARDDDCMYIMQVRGNAN